MRRIAFFFVFSPTYIPIFTILRFIDFSTLNVYRRRIYTTSWIRRSDNRAVGWSFNPRKKARTTVTTTTYSSLIDELWYNEEESLISRELDVWSGGWRNSTISSNVWRQMHTTSMLLVGGSNEVPKSMVFSRIIWHKGSKRSVILLSYAAEYKASEIVRNSGIKHYWP